MKRFVQEGRLPHLLFYGPPGTGKTSTAVSLASDIFGRSRSGMVLELNASDERGIGVVREQIKTFAATKTLNFKSGNDAGNHAANNTNNNFKIIILDECDAMTGAAQNALRRVMERYVRNVRFILICNYVGQIIPALQSRCTRFRFSPLPEPVLRQQVTQVASLEHIVVDPRAAQAVIRLAHGDMRRILNVLQAAAAAAARTARITEEIVYGVTAAPLPADLDRLFRTLLDQTDYSSALIRTPPPSLPLLSSVSAQVDHQGQRPCLGRSRWSLFRTSRRNQHPGRHAHLPHQTSRRHRVLLRRYALTF